MTNDQIKSDRSLQQLAWAIQAAVGQFKLMLAKCNYVQQRDRLIAKLQEISAVKISVLTLKPSQRTLYTAIREELGDNIQALMILGLDKLHDLPQMLIAANQVREEFRKSFPFPIVLWINDEIHQQLMQIAPDLESWTTTKNFAIAVDDLTQFLQNTAAQLFANVLNINLQNITEIQSAWQELQNQGQDLAPELKANCDFVLGLVAYINKNLDGAIEYYRQSLDYWQTVNNYQNQGKILAQITICYYEKARAEQRNRPQVGDSAADEAQNRPQPRSLGLSEQSLPAQAGNLEAAKAAFVGVAAPFRVSAVNRETISNYLQQTIAAFQTAQRPDLIANSLEQFGIILSYLEDWQQLKTLAQQALTVHEAENNPLKISQDYGFLAETELAQNNWQQAQEFAQTALKFVATTHQPVPPELSQLNIIAHRQKLLLIIAQAQENLAQQPAAINYLERARELSIADNDPQIYLIILDKLKSLYFQQKQYLQAFDAKLEARSIEQQFGLRAFIGAGRLQATKQLDTQVLTAVPTDNQGNIAPEIAASGRQLDVERLIERIGRPDYKLIVIHGQSGVGKSSLVNAGLIPALKQKAIGVQDNLVVCTRVYTNWVEELGRVLGGDEDAGTGRHRDAVIEEGKELEFDTPSSEHNNPSFLPDTPSSEHNNPSFLLDSSSSEHNNPSFLLDTPSSEHNNPSFLPDTPSSEHNNPSFLPDTPSSEHDNPSSDGENSTFSPDNLTSEANNPTSQPPLVPLPPAPCPLPPAPCPSPLTLLTQLRENEQRNLRTVLIFDQFEEFFFVYPEPKQRRQFFEFLGECLNILSVKVILSLRIDYLHYLLECNRLESLKIIGNDILSNNVLYELGNFSLSDTKAIIQRLTQNTSFYLEPGLIDRLVQDLAGELGEVRPIELQVVGAQLQTENITTLAKYQELGDNAKEELVKRYLAEVVDDCGAENQQAAELLLYLLTDEKGTRPLKTRTEIERDLQALLADVTTDSNKLDLVLEIFVKSGLVVLLPENPADRYQLVHDYLAAFIRQQQEPKLKQVMAELEEERKQRKISEEKLIIFEQRQQANQTLSIAQLRAKQEPLPRKIVPEWKETFGAITFSCLVLILRSIGLLQFLELAALDQLFRLRPNEPPEERITIVAIDEASLREVGSWPIPDAVIAQLLKKLNAYNPSAIGLGIYRDLPVEPGYEQLVKTYKSMPNLIGIEQLANNKNARVLPPPILNQLEQVGFNNVLYDLDGKIRRSLLYSHIDNQAYESFALKLALVYLKSYGITPQNAANNSESLQLGKAVFTQFEKNDGAYVGSDAGGYQIISNFPKLSCYSSSVNICAYRQVSLRDVLANRVSENWIKDRIILIGSTAPSLQDYVYIPYSSSLMDSAQPIAGIELQAHFVSELISAAINDRSRLKVWFDFWEYLSIFAWSTCGSILLLQFRSFKKYILSFLILGFSLFAAYYIAFLFGWWLPLVPSIIALLGSSIITAIINIVLINDRLEKFQFRRTIELIFEICSTNIVVGCLSIEYLINSTQEPEITAQILSRIAVSILRSCQTPDEIAPMVLFTCEKAVTLAPNNCKIRDNRGVARVLTGDYQGAIADFEAYIAQADDKDDKAQRQSWVKDLKAGKNPIKDDVLKKLRNS